MFNPKCIAIGKKDNRECEGDDPADKRYNKLCPVVAFYRESGFCHMQKRCDIPMNIGTASACLKNMSKPTVKNEDW